MDKSISYFIVKPSEKCTKETEPEWKKILKKLEEMDV